MLEGLLGGCSGAGAEGVVTFAFAEGAGAEAVPVNVFRTFWKADGALADFTGVPRPGVRVTRLPGTTALAALAAFVITG